MIKKAIRKLLIKVMVATIPLLLLLVIVSTVALILIGSNGNTNDNSDISMGTTSVSATVLAWKPEVEKYAKQFGIPQYVNLILALIQQESGGSSIDVMQASEGAFNTRYPKMPNGITDQIIRFFVEYKNLKRPLKRLVLKILTILKILV